MNDIIRKLWNGIAKIEANSIPGMREWWENQPLPMIRDYIEEFEIFIGENKSNPAICDRFCETTLADIQKLADHYNAVVRLARNELEQNKPGEYTAILTGANFQSKVTPMTWKELNEKYFS